MGFHRDLRSKNFLNSELTSIPGIGDKTTQKLISHFGSVKKIREANAEELEALVGSKITNTLLSYFKNRVDEITTES